MGCHCDDFSRAQAGRDLRGIEPGMPAPAGTGLSRRSFLARSSGLALSVFGGALLSQVAMEEGIAAAQALPSSPVLVSIFLPGGIDSLSVLAPVGDSRYATLRPNLALAPSSNPNDVFTEDDRLHWHPSAAPLRDLHRAGKLAVMPAVGYSGANQSHFTSRHYWEVGELNPASKVGWLGRYLDKHGVDDNPLQGLSLSRVLAPALASTDVPISAVAYPHRFELNANAFVSDQALRTKVLESFGRQGGLPTDDAELGAARRATRETVGVRSQVAPLLGTSSPWQSAVAYPAGVGLQERLAVLAEMLDMGLPLKVVSVDADGGFDTHANQNSSLTADLDVFARSLAAFQADLEARGLADRVLIHVWSEFGRRPKENGSGTDHGAAGLSFVVGTQAYGTMVGEFPGLAKLDPRSNLRNTSDFRAVYCSLLEQWLGVDAEGIVPGAGSFARPTLVR